MTDSPYPPIVYGSPGQIAVLIQATTRLLEHEPDEVFDDIDVRQAGRDLAGLIDRRVAAGEDLERPTPLGDEAAS